MSFCMFELHEFRNTGDHQFSVPESTTGGTLCASHDDQYYGDLGQACLSSTAFNYSMAQDYPVDQERNRTSSTLASSCEQLSLTPPPSIQPYHLDNQHQELPRTAFNDTRTTFQLLQSREQQYLNDNGASSSAYYLGDGFRTLEQAQYSTVFDFGGPQHSLYQTPYSKSISPGGSPSPITGGSSAQGMIRESLSFDDAAITPNQDIEEDSSNNCDKPYARLIWDALMQAPGHRMMLREIYTWFQIHTNKARDSGSTGWQNSIRHNLSMNQAFENDKSDPSISRGQPKKANSVWILTEHAVKHGVQSTTRYRKSGSGKKKPAGSKPAPQRQRSGARGGRAARKAAMQRRNEQEALSDQPSLSAITTPPGSYAVMEISQTINHADYISVHTPMTPTSDLQSSFSSAFGKPIYHHDATVYYSGEEDCMGSGALTQDGPTLQTKRDPCVDGFGHYHYGSGLHGISM